MSQQINRYARTKKLLGQILKEMQAVHEGMIQEALAIQRAEGGQIGQILVKQGNLDEATLQQALAEVPQVRAVSAVSLVLFSVAEPIGAGGGR